MARQITSLSSSDGNALLVNAYIGVNPQLNYRYPFDFHGYRTEQEVGQDNLRLFRLSSVIPVELTDGS